MLIFVQMLQSVGVEARGTTDDAMHVVSLREKQLGPVKRISICSAEKLSRSPRIICLLQTAERKHFELTGTIHPDL
jgi:hypothetical protein